MECHLNFLLFNIKFHYLWTILSLSIVTISVINCRKGRETYDPYVRGSTTGNPSTQKICLSYDSTLKARHKSCFLRPDTGPCRADIIQWYYDVKQQRCYRFYWGGCQGNGNRFETMTDCRSYCFLNATVADIPELPRFCSLSFEYGDCFGYFHRWGWDRFSKTCKRYMYSGCGGNQNNFQSNLECLRTCLSSPNNTLQTMNTYTTCVPLNMPEFQ